MKVFYTKPTCSYSGGIVLVAANTPEEALKVASEETRDAFTKWDYEKSCDYPAYDTYYEWATFQEVVGLAYETDEPKVIIQDFYAE